MKERGFSKNNFIRKNWFLLLLSLFVVVNVVLVLYNLVITKQKKNEYQELINEIKQDNQTSNIKPSAPNTYMNSYDLPCPEISEYSVSGEKINLNNLVGDVILLRFSRFYMEDLADLVYLQHLADKYRDQRVSLFFINTLGKHDEEEISKYISLTSPIIEDNGSITAKFNAFPEDLIIVDRNFSLKFKYNRGLKTVIYDEVTKWIFKEQLHQITEGIHDVLGSIKKLKYYDVLENETYKLIQQKRNKICLTIFTSICTRCEESLRIHHLKELSNEINEDSVEILILFGKGNTIEGIRQFTILNELDKFRISTGVMNVSSELDEKEYLKLFQLDADPRTLIISSEGQLTFFETRKTTKMINSNFLKEKLK